MLRPLFKIFALFPRPLPPAIWMLPRLRYLRFNVWYLSEPPCELIGWGNSALLANLQTVSEVGASFCTKEVLQQVPNLKKLGIWMEKWDAASFYVNHLVYLQELEVLKCRVIKFSPVPEVFSPVQLVFLHELAFPQPLKS
ncbi:disease resistance RPP8-like protein 3 [Forsythia ovata]|uniref:Disease resistance RPP8-like protein 3 n=1 Tax=Forsythia ovata TaxID=205694 RepID=A0ABD1TSB3_9LAMI